VVGGVRDAEEAWERGREWDEDEAFGDDCCDAESHRGDEICVVCFDGKGREEGGDGFFEEVPEVVVLVGKDLGDGDDFEIFFFEGGEELAIEELVLVFDEGVDAGVDFLELLSWGKPGEVLGAGRLLTDEFEASDSDLEKFIEVGICDG